jgi:hypothetical protein
MVYDRRVELGLTRVLRPRWRSAVRARFAGIRRN